MTKQKKNTLLKIGIGVLLLVIAWFNRDSIISFIKFTGDRQAVVDFMESLGAFGPLALIGLIVVQVLIPSLPAEPPMIAGAFIYGFPWALLMNWLVSVAASQVVFYLARRAGRPLVERFVPAKMLNKWTKKAGEKGAVFFMLAFIIPPIPSDIMTYVAGLSSITGERFFWATLIGRLPMVFLLTLVGASGFGITPSLVIGLTIFGLVMLAAWWYFIVREAPVSTFSKSENPQLFLNE